MHRSVINYHIEHTDSVQERVRMCANHLHVMKTRPEALHSAVSRFVMRLNDHISLVFLRNERISGRFLR